MLAQAGVSIASWMSARRAVGVQPGDGAVHDLTLSFRTRAATAIALGDLRCGKSAPGRLISSQLTAHIVRFGETGSISSGHSCFSASKRTIVLRQVRH